MHKISTRFGGGGGSIELLEIVAPKAILANTDYYLTPQGSLVAEDEVLPMVATPLVGSNASVTPLNTSWGGVTGGNFIQSPNPEVVWQQSNNNYRIKLSDTLVVYMSPASTNGQGYVSAFVYNTSTKTKLAEYAAAIAVNSSEYPSTGSYLAVLKSGVNKWIIVCNYTNDSGSTWAIRAGEFTYDGNSTITFAWKAVAGTYNANSYQTLACGEGVSFGKFVVSRSTTSFVYNAIANTLNSVGGTINTMATTDNFGFSLVGSVITRVDLETNGTTTVPTTGLALVASGGLLKLAPRVYLNGYNVTVTSNSLRLVIFNAGYTSANVVSLGGNYVGLTELDAPIVVQPVQNVLRFILTSGWQSTNDVAPAVEFEIDAAGTVVSPVKFVALPPTLRNFLASTQPAVLYPLKLWETVYSVVALLQTTQALTNRDGAACIFTEFRPDFYVGAFQPKYLGRSVGAAVQGAVATFIASPALLKVLPTLTAWTAVGRVIKVNDSQGFFLDYALQRTGLSLRNIDVLAGNYNQNVEDTGFNYPWVVGTDAVGSAGTLTLALRAASSGTEGYNLLIITPSGISYLSAGTTVTLAAELEVEFSGFVVLAARSATAGTRQCMLTLKLDEVDYV